MAKTAQEWAAIMGTKLSLERGPIPSLCGCLENLPAMFELQNHLDMRLCVYLVLSTIWSLVYSYRGRLASTRTLTPLHTHGGALVTNAQYQEAMALLHNVRSDAATFEVELDPTALLAFEHCCMHLHVSLEDIQVLAGRDGVEETRKMLQSSRDWFGRSEARLGVWHAGQVLSAAKRLPAGHLRESLAISLYHASLVFWAYAVIAACNKRVVELGNNHNAARSDALVAMDHDHNVEVQRFLHAGIGKPAITATRGARSRSIEHSEDRESILIPLSDGRSVAQNMIAVLRDRATEGMKHSPLLIDKLCELLHSLGEATGYVANT